MDVATIQKEIARRVQAALVTEVELSAEAAAEFTGEAMIEIKRLFSSRHSCIGCTLLFAIAKSGRHGTPDWLRINRDTLLSTIEATLGTMEVAVLDVMAIAHDVCDETIAGNPWYTAWKAREVAKRN